MVKFYPPIIQGLNIRQLHFASKAPDMSVSYTPFGRVDLGGTVYTKGPPKLKGAKGIPQPPALRAYNPKGTKHAPGVTTIYIPRKGYVLMPNSAAELYRKKKR